MPNGGFPVKLTRLFGEFTQCSEKETRMAGRKKAARPDDEEPEKVEDVEADDDEDDEDEDEDEDEEAEEGEEAAEEEAPADDDDDAGDDDDDDEEGGKKKKKKAKAKAKAKPKKAPAKRARASKKAVRQKAVWVVLDNSSKELETFPFNQKAEAEQFLATKSEDKKGLYLQMRKVNLVEE